MARPKKENTFLTLSDLQTIIDVMNTTSIVSAAVTDLVIGTSTGNVTIQYDSGTPFLIVGPPLVDDK